MESDGETIEFEIEIVESSPSNSQVSSGAASPVIEREDKSPPELVNKTTTIEFDALGEPEPELGSLAAVEQLKEFCGPAQQVIDEHQSLLLDIEDFAEIAPEESEILIEVRDELSAERAHEADDRLETTTEAIADSSHGGPEFVHEEEVGASAEQEQVIEAPAAEELITSSSHIEVCRSIPSGATSEQLDEAPREDLMPPATLEAPELESGATRPQPEAVSCPEPPEPELEAESVVLELSSDLQPPEPAVELEERPTPPPPQEERDPSESAPASPPPAPESNPSLELEVEPVSSQLLREILGAVVHLAEQVDAPVKLKPSETESALPIGRSGNNDVELEVQSEQQVEVSSGQTPTLDKLVNISISELEPRTEPEAELLPEAASAVRDKRRPSLATYAEDEDLEWEFDNEPAFEARQVEVKRNCEVRAHYELGEELGRGKFGFVYRCVELATGRKLAAKFVHVRRSQDREDVEREVEIMSRLQHQRLLQLYDAFDDTGRSEMCLITELVEGGELFERIVDDDFELTEKKAAVFMRQICQGVEYMHSQNIVHLDMKPENILCVSRTGNRIKLIDFGLARHLSPDDPLRVMFGTPDFAAPEVLAYDVVSLATDMWSVGVICYVLLSGLSPFMGDNDMDTMANVTRATYDFDDSAFDPISELAKDFISKLLVREQSHRLPPSDCLRHPWLQRGGLQLEISRRSSRRSSVAVIAGDLALAEESVTDSPLIISLDKRNLKKYVVRRKWHKTVHAIMALGRMGANLKLRL